LNTQCFLSLAKEAAEPLSNMDPQKAPRKTWYQPNGKFYAPRANQAGQQREQQPNKKTNSSFETSDRTKQIMRHVYPINNSGSKQLIIGVDPQDGFKPVITIRKPGFRGVVLSHEGSKMFLNELQALYGYCTSDSTERDLKPLELNSGESVEFGYSMEKKAIFIKKDLGDSQYANIILTGSTLLFIADLYDLLQYIFDVLLFNSDEIKQVYNMMLAKLQLQPSTKKHLIKTLSPGDINFTTENQSIDYSRVFLELRKYCELELLA
jgi:hypothetical protein